MKREYTPRGKGYLKGLHAAQREHKPDLTTDPKLLKDAIAMQSQVAMALYHEIMHEGKLHVVEAQKKTA